MNWAKNMDSPPDSCRLPNMLGLTSGGSAPGSRAMASSRRCSQRRNPYTTNSPVPMNQTVNEAPNRAGDPGLGTTHPHSLDRSTPYLFMQSPTTDNTEPK